MENPFGYKGYLRWATISHIAQRPDGGFVEVAAYPSCPAVWAQVVLVTDSEKFLKESLLED